MNVTTARSIAVPPRLTLLEGRSPLPLASTLTPIRPMRWLTLARPGRECDGSRTILCGFATARDGATTGSAIVAARNTETPRSAGSGEARVCRQVWTPPSTELHPIGSGRGLSTANENYFDTFHDPVDRAAFAALPTAPGDTPNVRVRDVSAGRMIRTAPRGRSGVDDTEDHRRAVERRR